MILQHTVGSRSSMRVVARQLWFRPRLTVRILLPATCCRMLQDDLQAHNLLYVSPSLDAGLLVIHAASMCKIISICFTWLSRDITSYEIFRRGALP